MNASQSTAMVPVTQVKDTSGIGKRSRAGLNRGRRFVSKNKIALIAGGLGAAGLGTLAYGAGKRKGRNEAQNEQ